MGTNPSYFADDDNLPVESVSAQEADSYCKALSAIKGRQVRLPDTGSEDHGLRVVVEIPQSG